MAHAKMAAVPGRDQTPDIGAKCVFRVSVTVHLPPTHDPRTMKGRASTVHNDTDVEGDCSVIGIASGVGCL